MQTDNKRIFFNELNLNLFKSLLLAGILTLPFNANANIASGYEKVGDIINFIGLDYGVVKSDFTDRFWLDRNLGAEQVCEEMKDELCYGDLYQWGRAKDGHQSRTSKTTDALAIDINLTSVTPGFFIDPHRINNDWTFRDISGKRREEAWKNNGVNTICPNGYSVPTINELMEETAYLGTMDAVFNGVLKIPAAGFRYNANGKLKWVGTGATLWSRSSYLAVYGVDTMAHYISYVQLSRRVVKDDRARGHSVRCIQDKH